MFPLVYTIPFVMHSQKPIVNAAFQFVILNSKEYNIDESHALKHSLDVFHYANKIYNSELSTNAQLKDHHLPIIYSSAILHDMCDKKYMNESEGVSRIETYMSPFMNDNDIEIMTRIITTMSYSKVKKYGYPDLGKYQSAYHIVREADLLSAYDFDRSLVYQMMHEKYNYVNSLDATHKLFQTRILNYRKDGLFVSDYAKQESDILHKKAINEMRFISELNSMLKHFPTTLPTILPTVASPENFENR